MNDIAGGLVFLAGAIILGIGVIRQARQPPRTLHNPNGGSDAQMVFWFVGLLVCLVAAIGLFSGKVHLQ